MRERALRNIMYHKVLFIKNVRLSQMIYTSSANAHHIYINNFIFLDMRQRALRNIMYHKVSFLKNVRLILSQVIIHFIIQYTLFFFYNKDY